MPTSPTMTKIDVGDDGRNFIIGRTCVRHTVTDIHHHASRTCRSIVPAPITMPFVRHEVFAADARKVRPNLQRSTTKIDNSSDRTKVRETYARNERKLARTTAIPCVPRTTSASQPLTTRSKKYLRTGTTISYTEKGRPCHDLQRKSRSSGWCPGTSVTCSDWYDGSLPMNQIRIKIEIRSKGSSNNQRQSILDRSDCIVHPTTRNPNACFKEPI